MKHLEKQMSVCTFVYRFVLHILSHICVFLAVYLTLVRFLCVCSVQGVDEAVVHG